MTEEWTRRSVPEWIADHPDQDIPKRVKLRIFDRHGGKCALTGRKLSAGEFDFDHIKRLRDGGQHREGNLQPVYRPAHREKTAQENTDGAKADRIKAKHNGLWPPARRKMQNRPFPGGR